MAFIETIPPERAEGRLASIYDAAQQRAGKVFQILQVQSLNAPVLAASMGLYQAVMYGEGPLTRVEREAVATVVSRTNDCFYWVKAHEADLRAEVAHELARDEPEADERLRARRAADFAADVAAQGSEAAPDPRLRALLQYAERLSLEPGEVEHVHVEALREAGYDDRAVHDAAQVVAYFSYINRIADGLGVDLEPDMA